MVHAVDYIFSDYRAFPIRDLISGVRHLGRQVRALVKNDDHQDQTAVIH